MSNQEPDKYCITTADGGCVGGAQAGLPPCMHDKEKLEKKLTKAKEKLGSKHLLAKPVNRSS